MVMVMVAMIMFIGWEWWYCHSTLYFLLYIPVLLIIIIYIYILLLYPYLLLNNTCYTHICSHLLPFLTIILEPFVCFPFLITHTHTHTHIYMYVSVVCEMVSGFYLFCCWLPMDWWTSSIDDIIVGITLSSSRSYVHIIPNMHWLLASCTLLSPLIPLLIIIIIGSSHFHCMPFFSLL